MKHKTSEFCTLPLGQHADKNELGLIALVHISSMFTINISLFTMFISHIAMLTFSIPISSKSALYI